MRAGKMSGPEQLLGFQDHELIVAPELMVSDIPRVEILRGVSMVAVYENAAGKTVSVEHDGYSWGRPFKPGDTVTRIDTGTAKASYDIDDDEGALAYCRGNVAQRTLDKGELLVASRRDLVDYGTSEAVLLPAGEPFPGEKGKVAYELLGVISPDGTLTGFDLQGLGASQRVDMCLAMQWADGPVDALVIAREWGINSSLINDLQLDKLASAYLQYWRDVRGEDYFPDIEPRKLFERFGYPDKEHIDWHTRTGGAVVALANS